MRLFARRVVLEPQFGRGDERYIIFREGQLDTPLAVITEMEATELLAELARQLSNTRREQRP